MSSKLDQANKQIEGSAKSDKRTTPTSTMITDDKPEVEKECINFMSKFRDKDTRALKNLNSTQFIEVWNNYDKDGK